LPDNGVPKLELGNEKNGGFMNTKAALILSLALIISTILYCFGTRYQMVMAARDYEYMYDRITGKSWLYLYGNYRPTLSPQERQERNKQQSQGPNKLRGRDKLVDRLVDEL
jgi:hypothetical protein